MKFLFNLLLILPLLARGQVSLLQSQGGSTSFLVAGGGIYVNTSESSLSGSFSFGKGGGGISSHLGINAKFKATESVTTILDGNDFKAQFDGSVYYIQSLKSGLDHKSRIHYLYVLGSITNAKYNVLPLPTSTEFDEHSFLGGNLTIGYNQVNAWGKSSTYLGFSLTGGNFNNVDFALKPVQRNLVNSATVNGQQVAILKDKTGGYDGQYQESNGGRFNVDAYVYPHFIHGDKVGVGGFARILRGNTFSTSTAGIGVVFGSPFDSGTAVFGVFYQFQTLFNEKPDGVSRSLSLTAGYNF